VELTKSQPSNPPAEVPVNLGVFVTGAGGFIGHSFCADLLFSRENPLAPFMAIMQKLVSRFGNGLGAGF